MSQGPGQPPIVPGYLLQEPLGRGGSGEVWRAVPRGGGTAVAVKVLVAGDPERQAREAVLLGELDHPHLVRLHEVVHQPRRGGASRVALVLDLLPGGSLAALLARRGRLRPGEVVTTIAPVAAALAHAHDNGVVHGDLSPGNIVFTAEGRPVLTDLGVARVLGEEAAAEVTPAYVDPTVARGGAPGPASDVFGVAAAAFHALTGIAPWNAATPADTLAVAAAGSLPDLRELAPDAPDELLAVICRGLAADPHERGSAAAFALDLRHACRPEPVRLPVPGVADEELSRTGAGPRTELTHQVPGRRPRAAVVPPASGSRHRRPSVRRRLLATAPGPAVRALARRAALLGLLTALLGGALWGGTHWGGAAGEGAEASSPAAAPPAPVEEAGEVDDRPGEVGGAPPARERGDTVDRQARPDSPADWQEVVQELYRRRAAAFASASAAPLVDVYAAGSPQLAADERYVGALLAAGETVRGFSPSVGPITAVDGSADRVTLQTIDGWPRYEVVPAADPGGPAVREGAARPPAAVRLVLVRTSSGWRIEGAERLA